MRILLDSNVIIAAFATRGVCAEVFSFCLRTQTIILSEDLITEIDRSLSKKLKLSNNKITAVKNFVRTHVEIVKPSTVIEKNLRDTEDLKVLAAAKAGHAQLIITGDQDLIVLKRFEKIEIISPRRFWNQYIGGLEK